MKQQWALKNSLNSYLYLNANICIVPKHRVKCENHT